MTRYAKPHTVTDALALLAERPWRLLAGGTDFYPAQGNRPVAEPVLDINGLAELRAITTTTTHLIIGARTTWGDIAASRTLPPAFAALKQAAREVGSVQIQNAGTVGGNLCNASPAADGVPALMILEAEVELASQGATRVLPLSEFILGNRRTALAPDELVTAIRIPTRATAGASSFVKLGARRYLVISVAMAAARVALRNGVVEDCAISVGACSEVAMRFPALEKSLVGRSAQGGLRQHVDPCYFEALQPIDDVRGSGDFRRKASCEIVSRALAAACSAAQAQQRSGLGAA
ncbi:xanthine dehydrogenase family protein subunit M [Mesorhizobium sp. NBSH29]|uniref:FAD binding domain-containing protein n=1 Tax=Mesorhizobium sp. NBSH29 TaxID=2654249 RepID=UPI0018966A69|nr:xanthine dehydrogenase family protein subunit M [Mesorhizobium sp. NBSH29]QPC86134.1 xanthine dehydrogenase family protein subunit M [Mesorhizobium sp. NBSH29]